MQRRFFHVRRQCKSAAQDLASRLAGLTDNERMKQALQIQALAQLRHLYQNMVSGGITTAEQARSVAQGLLSPAIAALEAQTAESEAQQPITPLKPLPQSSKAP